MQEEVVYLEVQLKRRAQLVRVYSGEVNRKSLQGLPNGLVIQLNSQVYSEVRVLQELGVGSLQVCLVGHQLRLRQLLLLIYLEELRQDSLRVQQVEAYLEAPLKRLLLEDSQASLDSQILRLHRVPKQDYSDSLKLNLDNPHLVEVFLEEHQPNHPSFLVKLPLSLAVLQLQLNQLLVPHSLEELNSSNNNLVRQQVDNPKQ